MFPCFCDFAFSIQLCHCLRRRRRRRMRLYVIENLFVNKSYVHIHTEKIIKKKPNRNIDLVALECCESDENETKNEQYNFPFVQAKNGKFVRTLTHAQLLI